MRRRRLWGLLLVVLLLGRGVVAVRASIRHRDSMSQVRRIGQGNERLAVEVGLFWFLIILELGLLDLGPLDVLC